jgi:hypothetical protein
LSVAGLAGLVLSYQLPARVSGGSSADRMGAGGTG